MSFSPRTVGDLLPIAQFTFQDDLINAVDISGQSMGNFSLVMVPKAGVDQPGVLRVVGSGTFSYVTNGADGKINYAWVAGDVAVAGQYNVYAVGIINSKTLTSDPIPLILNPKP